MLSRAAQWIIGTILAAAVALSVQMAGLRSDHAELRTDVRRLDDRLRAVEVEFGEGRSAARHAGAVAPAHPAGRLRHNPDHLRVLLAASATRPCRAA